MSQTFKRIKDLIEIMEVRISDHGYAEITEDALFVRDIVNGAKSGILVEDYPAYHKGPSVLILQRDRNNHPIHVVWGIPKDKTSPAVVVTAYRPHPERWTKDFLNRKKS